MVKFSTKPWETSEISKLASKVAEFPFLVSSMLAAYLRRRDPPGNHWEPPQSPDVVEMRHITSWYPGGNIRKDVENPWGVPFGKYNWFVWIKRETACSAPCPQKQEDMAARSLSFTTGTLEPKSWSTDRFLPGPAGSAGYDIGYVSVRANRIPRTIIFMMQTLSQVKDGMHRSVLLTHGWWSQGLTYHWIHYEFGSSFSPSGQSVTQNLLTCWLQNGTAINWW